MRSSHGHAIGKCTRTYVAWKAMLARCYNPNNPAYQNYGERGIRVCRRWRKFENFLADMSEVPNGLTLERKQNNLGYWKSNCLWATRQAQTRNRRCTVRFTENGITKTAAEWLEGSTISHALFQARVRKGMSVSEALSKPVDARGSQLQRTDQGTLRYKGETLTYRQWSEKTGIKRGTIIKRLRMGWSIKDALTP